MKEIRILFFITAFLLIVLAIQIEAEWLLYVVAGIYLTEAFLERIHERRKKAKAVFLVYDSMKTVQNYALYIGIITAGCMFFFHQGMTSIIFYTTYLLGLFISRLGDAYFLFDQKGIKTVRKTLKYSQIADIRFEEQGLVIETNNRSENMTISKKLLNTEILAFLDSKVCINSAV